ncbi:MAG: polymer-forming cytoskeletal protein [Candidatus Latescibacteria bacterium]|nr:polymer-forming cytoskeletal protein [Candidatus Latescibacterota bacterium]MCK5328149.1 polymer-forming cytoskeletal protein [Candidatus Latescibacterota bacterium]MCK5380571.1 polymer-forming cytoskeletal protein [Candidatus Latescibacterota bacterium]MCK5526348.1 polymer-forming cytoskeletal protein [Candidatus Latescibacterota bacterium]
MADKREALTIIDRDVEVEGTLKVKGKLIIVGVLKGTLVGDTVVTVEGSTVSARAQVRDLIIGGDFEGDVIVFERLKILNTGNFSGTAICNHLSVEAGGRLNGRVEPFNSEETSVTDDMELTATASMLQAATKAVVSGGSAGDTELSAAG